MDGVCYPVMYVVSFGGGATYQVALVDKKMHEAAGDNQGGEARVVVKVTSGGKTRTVSVEKISLYSEDSEYGLGDEVDWSTVDAAVADAVKAHLPAGTLRYAAFTDDGDHHAFHFEVYAVVRDAQGVHVVKQGWKNDGSEPDGEQTLPVKL
jgi:hypothetical protein